MPILNITLWKLPSASNILNCWDGNCRKIRHRKVVKSESFSFRWWSHSGGIFTKRIFQPEFFRCDSTTASSSGTASCDLMVHKTSVSKSFFKGVLFVNYCDDVVVSEEAADVRTCQNLLIPPALQVYPISIIIPPIEPQIRKKHNCSTDWYKIDY